MFVYPNYLPHCQPPFLQVLELVLLLPIHVPAISDSMHDCKMHSDIGDVKM